MASTSNGLPKPSCELSEWGLPPLIISWFKKKGISQLFDWQIECLCKNDVLFGGNLVYSAPTSAGKTLVGDFLLLKKVLEYGKKALVIEPFVALTREKAVTLKSMLYTTKARVGAFGGNYYTPGGMAAVHIAVCTIEKANNFVNKLINEGKLGELGIIVVDEIHYLGDERRGYQLELLLTKVMYYNSKQEMYRKIQIVGLSATIPNLESIAIWLQASLYVTDFRPVPLVEKIKIDKKIYDVAQYLRNPSCEPLEIVSAGKIALEKDFDDSCYICIESIVKGHSILVFCESKRECEIMANNLSNQIKYCGTQREGMTPSHENVCKKLRTNLDREKLRTVVDKLRKSPAGVDKELVQSLAYGVAFHHAGLTSEEREIIEDGFKSSIIKALFATSTLSSGVNLPARRVVIRSPTMVSTGPDGGYAKDMLNPTTYRQMIGRAGRKGIDTCGESILICKPENRDIAMKLIRASLGHIESTLGDRMIASEGEPSGLKKAILEVIANETATSRSDLKVYLESTFWFCSASLAEEKTFTNAVNETLRYLISKKFIEELKPGVYRSTRLGKAALSSGLHPDECLELSLDLIKAREGFCLLSDLHIIYQVTPNDLARGIDLKDWQHYSKIWTDLDEISQLVGRKVGIDEVVIARRCQGFTSSIGEEKERIYRRFWVSLIINDLITEIPLHKICGKYRVTKAKVQQVQRAVAQFAGVMSIFCHELGYDNISALVKPLEPRINFSCQRDLLDLIRLNVTRPIARALFSAGFSSVITVAKADKLDIEFIIRQMKPFKKESSFSHYASDAPSMWVPELAKNMTTLDYASHIVDNARSCVEIEYDIDIELVISNKRSEGETQIRTQSMGPNISMIQSPQQVIKRGRNDEERPQTDDTDISELETIPRLETAGERVVAQNLKPEPMQDVGVNKVEPPLKTPSKSRFVVEYVGSEQSSINKLLDKWASHRTICMNFKLERLAKQAIGVQAAKNYRRTSRRLSDPPNTNASQSSQTGTEGNLGLELSLDLDNIKQIVTRLYVSFDDDRTVYIVDSTVALTCIRDNLSNIIKSHFAAAVATQRGQSILPIKLYVQNIVLTYKVLYAAFNLEEIVLNEYFEWHAFDVAWWLIGGCPNHGHNNRNSSLSLVANTKWAEKYHHYLYPSDNNPNKRARRRSLERQALYPCEPSTSAAGGFHPNEFKRIKDVVKSGKTVILRPLIEEIMTELKVQNQYTAYSVAEIQSRLTMAQMMIHGIGLNMKFLKDELSLYEDLSQQMNDVAQKYYAKSNMSLSSIKQVARVLYDDLDLKKYLLEHATNCDISKDPTNAEVLTILSKHHPFPKLVQDFRRLEKALEALQSVSTHARYNDEINMMRVFGHCDFWQTTGRVSMVDPDLFLINRNFNVTIPAHGNREAEVVECAPRRCFVPSKDWLLVAADYSQLELRLLAHYSQDGNLLDILNGNNLDCNQNTADVFKIVASKVYKKKLEHVSSENRQHAKQICYGIIYGMGNKTLANHLGVDVETAEVFRQDFFSAFQQIQTFTDNLIKQCQQTGYVESLLGRRRYIEGINSDNSSIRARAERVAINTRIQSSASDIIKLSMQRVNKELLAHYDCDVRLVLEMHDELIYEVNPSLHQQFAKSLQTIMEDISEQHELKVKLLVNLKKGSDWSKLETFIIEES